MRTPTDEKIKYTLKDIRDAKTVGIREGIEQAQEVVLALDNKLLETMQLCIELGKSTSAEEYKRQHDTVWMLYQDLIVLADHAERG